MNKLKRKLFEAPILKNWTKAIVGIIITILFIFSYSNFIDFFGRNPLPVFIGIFLAAALYIPTMVALRFFGRREWQPWQFVIFVTLSVIFIFGPVAGQINFISPRMLLTVGINEELMKIAPLLLLVVFIPRSVKGVRDGIVYGALGGLGFAIIEFATYAGLENFDALGWSSFNQQMGRTNFLGTHNHVIWAATVGSFIGWATTQKGKWRRFGIPFLAYLGVSLLHTFEDLGGNMLTVVLSGALLEPLIMKLPNAETIANSNIIQMVFGTFNVLMINIILYPILWKKLRQSGDLERSILREQLKTETTSIITSEEYEGVFADRKFKSRKIPHMSKTKGQKLMQLQNELGFLKQYHCDQATKSELDPVVISLRQQISDLRVK